MKTELTIGILSDYQPWARRVSWLLGHEFGYPIRQVKDPIGCFPLLVVPDSAFTNEVNLIKYIKNSQSILICHNSKDVRTIKTPKGFPFTFGEVKDVIGDGTVNISHHLAKFFQYYSFNLGTRKLSLNVRIIKNFSPRETIFELVQENGSHIPLLVCTRSGKHKYAVITLGDADIETSRCGALLYLAALHYLLSDKPFIRKWFWKRKKRAMIVVTFDVEGLAKYSNMKRYWWWDRRFDEVLLRLGLRPIVRDLRRLQIPSTWFILASQVAQSHYLQKFFRNELRNGLIEVAGHGDLHPGIDKLGKRFDKVNRDEQSQRLAFMKKIISNTLLINTSGFRAPGLYANSDTIKALQENYFIWDSSVSPQSNLPFREFIWPFHPIIDWDRGETEPLIEIPIQAPWDRWCPLHRCFHSPKEYEREIEQSFLDIWFLGGIQVLLIHPYELPKYPGYWRALVLHLERLLRRDDIEITTCGQVAQGWKQRDKMLINAMYDDINDLIHVNIQNGQPGLTLFVHVPKGRIIKNISDDEGMQIGYDLWNDLDGAVFSINGYQKEYIIHLEKILDLSDNQ